MKLWQKTNTILHPEVEKFTVGKDRYFDKYLVLYDLEAGMAHANMLCSCGFLTTTEREKIISLLERLKEKSSLQGFEIPEAFEDMHSWIEAELISELGDTGKKIHTARSRNDQVLTALKLYYRAQLLEISDKAEQWCCLLLEKSGTHADVFMPGFTHCRPGMPSSAGLWLSSFAEALCDDLEMVAGAMAICDKNPLGSGAGYGSSFPISRKETTEYLGFSTYNKNSLHAQMSRQKVESAIAFALASMGQTLSRFSSDCILFSAPEYNILQMPPDFCTGSRLQSLPQEIVSLYHNLPSGYHRDFQLSKEIMIPALNRINHCLDMAFLLTGGLKFSENILEREIYNQVFAVEAISGKVQGGMSFRDAYRETGDAIEEGKFLFNDTPAQATHEGSTGNLCLPELKEDLKRVMEKIRRKNQ
jgi:argininosuccinate lyase